MSDIAFWTGASGMRAFQSKLDVVAHNIANVNTFGYKTRRASFDELIHSRINTNVEGEHLVGHGVKQEYVDILQQQEALASTGYPLDFAIAGDGYFAVDVNGETMYTRNGAFSISVEDGGNFLVSNDGAYVLDSAGQRIQLAYDDTGELDISDLSERIAVYGFDNPYGLIPRDNARVLPSENTGEPTLLTRGAGDAGSYQLLTQTIERSGVDMANEMTEIINAQRAYQLNSRVIQMADQLAEEVNNLR